MTAAHTPPPTTPTGASSSRGEKARHALLGATLLLVPLVLIVLPVAALVPHAAYPTGPVLRSLLLDSLSAAGGAAGAAVIGSCAALAVQFLPQGARNAVDLACLVPVTFPHFVVGMALRELATRWASGQLPQGGFSGPVAVVATFSVSLFPLTYYALRVRLARINPQAIDAARVAGLQGLRLARLTVAGPLLKTTPAVAVVSFIIALSDPVTSDLLDPGRRSVASHIWLGANAYGTWGTGSGDEASGMALVLLAPAAGAVVLYLCLRTLSKGRRGALRGLGGPGPGFERAWTSGTGSVPRAALLVAAIAVGTALVPPLVMATRLLTLPPTRGLQREVLLNTIALAAIGLVVATALALLGVLARARFGRVVDLLLVLPLVAPGATLGRGYQLLVAAADRAAVRRLHGFSAGASNLLPSTGALDTHLPFIVLASLQMALPLTYFALVQAGPLISSREFEMARCLGAGRLRCLSRIVLPRLANYAVAGFLIVLSTGAVMVSPSLWVNSSETSVVVPRLFSLLDASDYSNAFSLTLSTSALIITLAILGRVGLRLTETGRRWER